MKDTILYGTVAILLLLVFAAYTAEAAQSEVTLRPGSINSFQCSSVTGKINIKAGTPGEFDILIEGVPSSWLEYPESVRVDDEKTVNYIINPQKPGTYYLSVMVDGPRGYFFEDEIRLWASTKETADMDEPEGEDSGFGGGLEGMFAFGEQEKLVLMIMAVVVAAIFAVFLASRTLKEEDPYDDGV